MIRILVAWHLFLEVTASQQLLGSAGCRVIHGGEACSDVEISSQEEREGAAASMELLQLSSRKQIKFARGIMAREAPLKSSLNDYSKKTLNISINEATAKPLQLSPLTPRVAMAPTPAPADYLQASMPLAWTHVPKCGTSFLNSLVRLPGVCPDLPVGDTAYGTEIHLAFPDWRERCTGLYSSDPRIEKGGSHVNVGSDFETVYRNHGLIMLRQPEQRLISMYNQAASGLDALGGKELVDMYNMTLIDFANATAGCAVRMLTKEGFGWAGCMGVEPVGLEFTAALEVSVTDAYVAKKRLRGYVFVGITEYWPESVCLLHAMFGGDCNPAEFVDTRLASATDYDVSELQGFVDQYDGILYEEALSIFTENLERYRVSQKSCQQCFQSGGVSASEWKFASP